MADETTLLVQPRENNRTREIILQLLFEAICEALSAASIAPYLVITSDSAKYYTVSVAATNFFINRVAAETALKFLHEKLSEKKYGQFVASLIFSGLTALPLTFIAYDHAKKDKVLIVLASFIGNAAINALALTAIVKTGKNFSSLERERKKIQREIHLLEARIKKNLASGVLTGNETLEDAIAKINENDPLKNVSTSVFRLGKTLEFFLKLSLVIAMTFCALILTAATEMAFRKSFHQDDDIAFAEAATLMTPIILLCAIGGLERGEYIAKQIATYYQANVLHLEQSKKSIVIATLFAMGFGSLSGEMIKKLQETTCDDSLLRFLTIFLGANIAAFVSAVIFNINYCYLSLQNLRLFFVGICCKPSATHENTGAQELINDLTKLKKDISCVKTKEELEEIGKRYAAFFSTGNTSSINAASSDYVASMA